MIVLTPDGTTVQVPTDPSGPYAELIESSFHVALTTPDGLVWDLNNGPNVFLVEGVKLFGTPPVTHWWGARPMAAGSKWRGVHYDNREPLLPVTIEADDWATWRDVDSRFFASVIPEVESLITVTSPDAISRYLRARLVDDGDVADDIDPLLFARKSYVLQMVSGQPLWEGDEIPIGPFTAGAPKSFYPGPPWHLSGSRSTATASVTNPGAFPAWWWMTLTGPIPGFSVGVGDALVTSTTPIAAGDAVTIDAGRHTIVDQDGADWFENTIQADWAPIPRGTDVPIVVDIAGTSTGWSVVGGFTPTYRRPW